GTVLIHQRKALLAALGRAGFGDVDDACVKIAVLAGDALVDLVGDDVRDPPPVLPRRRVGEAGELLLGADIPQPELDAVAAVALPLYRSRDEGLRVDLPPIGKARPLARRDVLDEALRIQWTEQAGAFEIGRHDLRDVAPGFSLVGTAAGESRYRDRHRLDLAARHVEAQLGQCRRDGRQQGENDQ